VCWHSHTGALFPSLALFFETFYISSLSLSNRLSFSHSDKKLCCRAYKHNLAVQKSAWLSAGSVTLPSATTTSFLQVELQPLLVSIAGIFIYKILKENTHKKAG
jgi:hypothetical protein